VLEEDMNILKQMKIAGLQDYKIGGLPGWLGNNINPLSVRDV